MEKVLYFDYAALILDVVFLTSILMRKMFNSKLNRVFIVMVTVVIFNTAADIIAVSLDNSGRGLLIEKYVFHSVYLTLHVFSAFLFLYYVIILTDTWFKAANSVFKCLGLFVPLTLVAAEMAANTATGYMFYFDGNDAYTRGSHFILLYAVTIYYSVYAFVKMIKYRKLIGKSRMLSLSVALLLMLGAAAIQFAIPGLLVDMFASAIGLMYMFMMVQRPEEIVDVETGLNKLSAYINDLRRSFMNEKSETLIMVQMTNYLVIREMLGYNDTIEFKNIIVGDILKYLKKNRIKADVYYIGSGNFRLKLDIQCEKYAEKAAEYLNSYLKNVMDYHELQINIVACVCIVRIPDDIEDLESLMVFEGDLNAAKYTGNVLYASDIYHKDKYDIMREIDKIIENAISENEFEVYYQPIYSIEEHRFNSAEALLRLKSKKFGFISPEVFIPAAEKSGAIHRIGDMVMESVCSFIGSDEFNELGLEYIEVNLSPAQCLENNLAEHMIDIINRNNVLPSQVNLEITETAAGEIQNAIMDNITCLHEAGVSLSLDDFGTGYSNLRRIASLPFHIIKLDKTFTQIDENPNLVIVLENVVKMIKDLNMKIVVEGIETKELVERFSDMECEYIQGYYYSKPLPKSELISFLTSNRVG